MGLVGLWVWVGSWVQIFTMVWVGSKKLDQLTTLRQRTDGFSSGSSGLPPRTFSQSANHMKYTSSSKHVFRLQTFDVLQMHIPCNLLSALLARVASLNTFDEGLCKQCGTGIILKSVGFAGNLARGSN